ncbi:MAG TPA: PEGA domain-containing protein [Polyangiaceae bacterium]|nr:PEGA domain-containing protein [Polyangiaceae bacterium]
MTRRARSLVVGLAIQVGLVCSGARGSRADGGAIEPAREAAAHFDRGVKLYDEQDWRAALIEFERAYAVSPHYRVLFDIAQCRYQLRDYVGALAAFQKYLAEGAAEIPAARRDQAQATVDELKGRIAQVRVTTDVAGAQIVVDDAPVGATPLAGPVLVSAGRRRIVATKAGRASVERVVDVAGQDVVDVVFRFGPEAHPAPDLGRGGAAGAGRPVWPAAAAFAVGGVGLAVGSVFGVLALGDKQDLDRACPNKACPPSSQSLIDEANRYGVVSTVGMAVAAAGVLGAAGYLLLAPGRDKAGTTASVRPFVGPGVAGAVGRF